MLTRVARVLEATLDVKSGMCVSGVRSYRSMIRSSCEQAVALDTVCSEGGQ